MGKSNRIVYRIRRFNYLELIKFSPGCKRGFDWFSRLFLLCLSYITSLNSITWWMVYLVLGALGYFHTMVHQALLDRSIKFAIIGPPQRRSNKSGWSLHAKVIQPVSEWPLKRDEICSSSVAGSTRNC